MSSRSPRPLDTDQGLPIAGRVLDAPDSSLLDVLDSLLNKGVMVSGDVTLGVAGIDLIYLRLSSILCAADRVLPPDRGAGRKPLRHRKPSAARHRR
jgi:gas vesicle protein GvpA/GvpJ/GvpM family